MPPLFASPFCSVSRFFHVQNVHVLLCAYAINDEGADTFSPHLQNFSIRHCWERALLAVRKGIWSQIFQSHGKKSTLMVDMSEPLHSCKYISF